MWLESPLDLKIVFLVGGYDDVSILGRVLPWFAIARLRSLPGPIASDEHELKNLGVRVSMFYKRSQISNSSSRRSSAVDRGSDLHIHGDTTDVCL